MLPPIVFQDRRKLAGKPVELPSALVRLMSSKWSYVRQIDKMRFMFNDYTILSPKAVTIDTVR
ncbi:MAG: hypothetical protein FWG02_11280 [Holophagaceae bacterium]|nr:hypothetical protein [Holophagaceae bacterium]